MIDDLDNVDFVSTKVHSSRQESLLYIFEDNEAVIKMIINGRSPTMRHASRTHRASDTVPSYLFNTGLGDETIGKALSSPLFIQERGESADPRQAYHSNEEVCGQLSHFSHTQERGDPCTNLVR